MCAGKDAQWAVRGTRFVQVDAEGDDLIESLGGRMCIKDSRLGGPWSPARNLPASSNRERRVLVPDNQPVSITGLVEQSCAEGKRSMPEERAGNLEKTWIVCKRSDG